MRKIEILKNGVRLVEAILANNYFLRLRGLLGRTLKPGEGLLLTPCNQIHTFGMGYPIDVVYLDASNRVLRVDAEVMPGRACKAVHGAKKVLELPGNGARDSGIAEGDGLEVKQ